MVRRRSGRDARDGEVTGGVGEDRAHRPIRCRRLVVIAGVAIDDESIADPATASSIIVTTATDVSSMGLLLALATALVR